MPKTKQTSVCFYRAYSDDMVSKVEERDIGLKAKEAQEWGAYAFQFYNVEYDSSDWNSESIFSDTSPKYFIGAEIVDGFRAEYLKEDKTLSQRQSEILDHMIFQMWKDHIKEVVWIRNSAWFEAYDPKKHVLLIPTLESTKA